jgi:hypothetical protein
MFGGLTGLSAQTSRRPISQVSSSGYSCALSARQNAETERQPRGASPARWQLHGEVLAKARWGAAGWDSRAHACRKTNTALRPAQHSTDCGVERLHAKLLWRRGHGHGAHGCGRPAPALTITCNSIPTARRPGHSSASPAPPRRLAQRRAAAERALLHTGLAARRAFGTLLDGAAQGDSQPSLHSCPVPTLARSLGRRGLGWPRPQSPAGTARRGVAHGEAAARRVQQQAARRHAHRQAKKRRGARRRKGGFGAHSGSTVESLQARRGRRCSVGVEVHGGALLRSGSPSVALASFPVRLLAASSRLSSNAPAAARVGPPPRLLFPNSPLLLPPPTAALGRGKNPNAGWWRWSSGACSPPPFESTAPQGAGRFSGAAPRLGPPGARGGAGLSLTRGR